eukprot:TRINITY_DN2063_c1_g1_i3.p1 TRINITY_DN2063_c1_g1~~TRINITY_DN2063_c1_g1_i3.p1  ORF type:complete len:1047 (-),score=213.22 TRINITY_DN2063_c1_g1_i3:60-3200(-)
MHKFKRGITRSNSVDDDGVSVVASNKSSSSSERPPPKLIGLTKAKSNGDLPIPSFARHGDPSLKPPQNGRTAPSYALVDNNLGTDHSNGTNGHRTHSKNTKQSDSESGANSYTEESPRARESSLVGDHSNSSNGGCGGEDGGEGSPAGTGDGSTDGGEKPNFLSPRKADGKKKKGTARKHSTDEGSRPEKRKRREKRKNSGTDSTPYSKDIPHTPCTSDDTDDGENASGASTMNGSGGVTPSMLAPPAVEKKGKMDRIKGSLFNFQKDKRPSVDMSAVSTTTTTTPSDGATTPNKKLSKERSDKPEKPEKPEKPLKVAKTHRKVKSDSRGAEKNSEREPPTVTVTISSADSQPAKQGDATSTTLTSDASGDLTGGVMSDGTKATDTKKQKEGKGKAHKQKKAKSKSKTKLKKKNKAISAPDASDAAIDNDSTKKRKRRKRKRKTAVIKSSSDTEAELEKSVNMYLPNGSWRRRKSVDTIKDKNRDKLTGSGCVEYEESAERRRLSITASTRNSVEKPLTEKHSVETLEGQTLDIVVRPFCVTKMFEAQMDIEFEQLNRLDEKRKQESSGEEAAFNPALDYQNISKNRYNNVLPNPDTRVKLQSSRDGTDYINANFVQGERECYIACQAPLPNTFGDFWRMVYEQRSYVIIMLTRLTERDRVKAEQYWPSSGPLTRPRLLKTMQRPTVYAPERSSLSDSDELLKLLTAASNDSAPNTPKSKPRSNELIDLSEGDDFLNCIEKSPRTAVNDVELKRPDTSDQRGFLEEEDQDWGYTEYDTIAVRLQRTQQPSKNLTIRHFFMKSRTMKDGELIQEPPRRVVQIHYTGWPDFGKPKSTTTVHKLMELMDYYRRTAPPDMNGPMILHCSAGLGRTGTLIAAHIAIEKVRLGRVKDVLDTDMRQVVVDLRQQRSGMVQTKDQYLFVHQLIREYIPSSEDALALTDAPSTTTTTTTTTTNSTSTSSSSTASTTNSTPPEPSSPPTTTTTAPSDPDPKQRTSKEKKPTTSNNTQKEKPAPVDAAAVVVGEGPRSFEGRSVAAKELLCHKNATL